MTYQELVTTIKKETSGAIIMGRYSYTGGEIVLSDTDTWNAQSKWTDTVR
ncbi:MAG: hypothetical protein Fur0021_12200 [Candidatus Promineifilaceae bacterium]